MNYWRLFSSVVLGVIIVSCGKSRLDEAYELKGLGLQEQAKIAFENLISDNPKDGDAYFGLANILAENKNYDDAITNYENALKIDPTNVRYKIHLLRIASLKRLGKYDQVYLPMEESLPKQIRLVVASYRARHESISTYLNIVGQLIKEKPLTDWQMIYDSLETRSCFVSYCLFRDRVKYYSVDQQYSGEFNSGDRIRPTNFRNDSIYFLDESVRRPGGKGKAWRFVSLKAERAYQGSKYAEIVPVSVPGIYDHPGVPASLDDRIFRSARFHYVDEDPLALQLATKTIVDGSIIPTGRKSSHRYRKQNEVGYGYEPVWEEVEYTMSVPVQMAMSVSNKMILFGNNFNEKALDSGRVASIPEDILTNLLSVGMVAKNMTLDFFMKKIQGKEYVSFYNKDELLEYISNRDYKFTFKDGLLESIEQLKEK